MPCDNDMRLRQFVQRVNLEDTMAEVIEVVSKKDVARGSSTSGEVRGQQVAVFYIWNEKTP